MLWCESPGVDRHQEADTKGLLLVRISAHESADVDNLVVKRIGRRSALLQMKPVFNFLDDPGKLRALLYENIYLFLQLKRLKFHITEVKGKMSELPQRVQHLMNDRQVIALKILRSMAPDAPAGEIPLSRLQHQYGVNTDGTFVLSQLDPHLVKGRPHAGMADHARDQRFLVVGDIVVRSSNREKQLDFELGHQIQKQPGELLPGHLGLVAGEKDQIMLALRPGEVEFIGGKAVLSHLSFIDARRRPTVSIAVEKIR